MSMKTQGTDLYVKDPVNDAVLTVSCVTEISGPQSQRGSFTVPPCLSDPQGKSGKAPGELTPGALTFGISTDTSNPDHIRLHELLVSGDDLKWALGWSDGPRDAQGESLAPPTGIDSAGDYILPNTRSWLVWDGFISTYPFNFPPNQVVASTIGVEQTSVETPIPKAA